MKDSGTVSIVIPACNESENIRPLVEAMEKMFAASGLEGDTLLVDDGSTDGTAAVARGLQREYPFLKVLSYQPNRGLTHALETGFRAAKGDVIVFYPADMQYHPDDIPAMVAKLNEGFDIVTGWKQGHYEKKLVSGVYNWLSRVLFRVTVHDLNSVKAFRREIIDVLDFRQDFHRYMVVMAVQAGFKAGEVKVTLYPRASGKSKFGSPLRVLVGLMDMLAVWFQYSFIKKPMLFFGIGGIACFLLGGILGLVALYMRYGLGVGFRPLLTLVSMLITLGITLFGFGFLGESVQETNRRIAKIESERNNTHREDES
jgi:glycosyltransferase involved in cell wall biosynthesis